MLRELLEQMYPTLLEAGVSKKYLDKFLVDLVCVINQEAIFSKFDLIRRNQYALVLEIKVIYSDEVWANLLKHKNLPEVKRLKEAQKNLKQAVMELIK